ncbi:MAG: hypothetical protein SGCHY_002166 [Lobulomycetales sp.]
MGQVASLLERPQGTDIDLTAGTTRPSQEAQRSQPVDIKVSPPARSETVEQSSEGPLSASYSLRKLPATIKKIPSPTFSSPTNTFNVPSEKERAMYANTSKITHDYGLIGPFARMTSIHDDIGSSAPAAAGATNIPIWLTWTRGGQTVYVTGTFNDWKQKIRLQRDVEDSDLSTIVDLQPGTHKLKFIVDDEWKCSKDLPIITEDDGNMVNCITVHDASGTDLGDGFDSIATINRPADRDGKLASSSKFVDSEYSSVIPAYLLKAGGRKTEFLSEELVQEAGSSKLVQDPTNTMPTGLPPPLPTYCHPKFLNNSVGGSRQTLDPASMIEPTVLPCPNHVVLNHLYACSIRYFCMRLLNKLHFRDNVITVASSSRYRKKVLLC